MRVTAVFAVCLSIAGAIVSAQVFRSGVTAVVLDVIVTDEQGHPVPDLTKADFEVVEDGRAREVISATFVSLALEGIRSLSPFQDVWTNAVTRERRVFTIVLDDLNVSPSDALRAREIVRRFIAELPDGDLIAVVYAGHQTGAQEFTADKTRLLAAIEQFTGGRPASRDEFGPDESRGDVSFQNRGNAHRVLATLQNVTDWLAGTEGRRKAVLLVTAGTLFPRGLDPFTVPEFAHELRQITTTAMRANVAIYPVGVRGLSAPEDRGSGTTSPLLRALADATGGVATINTNDFGRDFQTIVRDSSAYYLVGYTPADSAAAKTPLLHHVVVRTRRAGTVVRARQMYESGQSLSRNETVGMTHVLGSPLPGGRLPIELQATSFADAKGRGRVVAVLEISGKDVAFEQRGARQTATLIVQVVATDVAGRVLARDSRKLDFRVSVDRREQIGASRTRSVSSLDLKPGTYRIRAGVIDDQAHHFGVVAGDLDVPDYAKSRLALSGILLASRSTAHVPTLRDNAALFETRLPSPPTTQRAFDSDGGAELYAEAYGPLPGEPVDATVSILDSAGRLLSEEPRRIASQSRGLAGRLCYPIRAPLRLDRLQRGYYVVQLTTRASGAAEATRRLAFEIR